jgi:hypothetical protein
MRMPHAFAVCVCLLGATPLIFSQTKAAAIPGYYNPATGEFTSHIASSAAAQPQAAYTGTSIFFREDFPITITNYDQPPGAQVVCAVSMFSVGDINAFSEIAEASAVYSGGTWSCDVPVLTLWTLRTPATDLISASVSVTIYSQISTTAPTILRQSTQGFSLTVPANTATVENNVSFQL